jgi:hypothetical protein
MSSLTSTASLEIGVLITQLGGGLALFLFGMRRMTESLKIVAGAITTAVIQSSSVTTVSIATGPLRQWRPFVDIMQNPLLAIAIGAAFTAVVQSSSATTGIVILLASHRESAGGNRDISALEHVDPEDCTTLSTGPGNSACLSVFLLCCAPKYQHRRDRIESAVSGT